MPTEPCDAEARGRNPRMVLKTTWRQVCQFLHPMLPHVHWTTSTPPEIVEDIVRSPHLPLVGALLLFLLAYAKVVSVTVAIALALAWCISVFGIARSGRVKSLSRKLRLLVSMGSAVLLGAGFIGFGHWALAQYESQSQQESKQKSAPLSGDSPAIQQPRAEPKIEPTPRTAPERSNKQQRQATAEQIAGLITKRLQQSRSQQQSGPNPEMQLAKEAQNAAEHCWDFLRASNKRMQQATKDIEEYNSLSADRTADLTESFRQWRLENYSNGEMRMCHQIYKDEFFHVHRQLIEKVPDAARTSIDYEQPGNLGGVTGICSDLENLIRVYVNKLVAEGKRQPQARSPRQPLCALVRLG